MTMLESQKHLIFCKIWYYESVIRITLLHDSNYYYKTFRNHFHVAMIWIKSSIIWIITAWFESHTTWFKSDRTPFPWVCFYNFDSNHMFSWIKSCDLNHIMCDSNDTNEFSYVCGSWFKSPDLLTRIIFLAHDSNHTPFSPTFVLDLQHISNHFHSKPFIILEIRTSIIDLKFHNTLFLWYSKGFWICFMCFANKFFHLLPHLVFIFVRI